MNAGSQCEGFKVQAVYSRSMEKAKEYAEKYGIEDCYDSLDALAAAKDIDAVYVASPNALHAGQSIKMLKAGTAHTRLCRKVVYITHMVGHSEYQGSYLRKTVMPFAQLF